MSKTTLLILFSIAQVLNVITSTIKYVATVKSKPSVAAIVNALSYTIGNIVTILLVKQDVYFAIVITFISNLVGVPLGRLIVDKLTKDRLFIFTATAKTQLDKILELKEYLKDFGIQSTWQEITEDLYRVDIYSNSKAQSDIIRDRLSELNCKYHIIEAH